MTEVNKDNFWDTDLKDLPWALEINENTPIINSINGLPIEKYTQWEISKVDNILDWE